MTAKYESELLQVIHEDMQGLHRLGIISDAEMEEYDRECLLQEKDANPQPEPEQSAVIKNARSARA